MNRVRSLRIEKGVEISMLSYVLGISQDSMHAYEDLDKQPNWYNASLLADYYNVSQAYLLGETDVRDYSKLIEDVQDELREAKQELRLARRNNWISPDNIRQICNRKNLLQARVKHLKEEQRKYGNSSTR
ncbi:hypothetical protein [Leuconostoc citreum]|uniref:hypothetical protein n=1 Tax=Leuconostoc citreum TaxID=33964 RepID=UPI00295868FE|nr:hypothetical protein [Leuconostoc citreum]MDV8931173.1 hypothetical protein [Leuconostoc citreum]